MKYEYITATGNSEIDVDERFHDLLITLDREEYNSNRRHSRRHPVALERAYEGAWFADNCNNVSEIETAVDMEEALASLTNLQRRCFVETRLNGKSQRALASELGKSRSTVQHAVDGAAAILKNFFS